MAQANVIVIRSQSWRDTERTKTFKFRTALHLFDGMDDEIGSHRDDRILVWRHAKDCRMREQALLQPLWSQDMSGEWRTACPDCEADLQVYRLPPIWWGWRLLAWIATRILAIPGRRPPISKATVGR